MGLAGIPLDIMTITIAAIVVGIGVDDCIHYLHRFRDEIAMDQDYRAAMLRSTAVSAGDVLHHADRGGGVCHAHLVQLHAESVFRCTDGGRDDRRCRWRTLLLPQLIMIFRPFGPDRG